MAGYNDDPTVALLYGVLDDGLTVHVTSDGTDVTTAQTTESVDGHLAFASVVPEHGTTLSVEVRDANGTVVKRYDNVAH